MPTTNIFLRTSRPVEGFYTSEVLAPERQPVRAFLPTGYEPNYPYPLLVFFHGHGGSEEHVLELAPRLSRRNFICIGLRGPRPALARHGTRPGFTWDPSGPCDAFVEDYVFGAVEQTRCTYHIHSERIYLAGICEGAVPAYRLGLMYPQHFGGVIALNGTLPRCPGPLFRFPEIRQFRVFIGHGIANARAPLSSARKDFLALYTAGAAVEMHTYPATHRLHTDMLRDVNRWVIDRCNGD
jgi:phospholipase/carboxylesterase